MKFIKYTLLSALLIFTLLFMVGCDTEHDTPVTSPYYGGIHGLEAEFERVGRVSDTGERASVWEDESFPLAVRLRNKGEFTIPSHEVEMNIKGIAKNDFSGIDFHKTNDEEIDKVSQFMPDGGTLFVDFGNAKYNYLEGTHYDANIYLEYTYPYETYINIPRVCYKYDIRDDSVCTVDSRRQAFASGGPIRIREVKQSYIGRSNMMLEIEIENLGGGRAKAHKSDSFSSDWDEVFFRVGDTDWACESHGTSDSNVARMHRTGDKKATIRCTNDNLEKDALYTRAITLTLEYYYRDKVSQTVRIKEVP